MPRLCPVTPWTLLKSPLTGGLFDISQTAIDVAALGRIVRDIAEESFTPDDVSDFLTRLSALGTCIDRLSQQIVEQMPTDCDTLQQLSEGTPE